ncbi:hypothetical protein L226DRAFT_540478 [Lentinus tigrinus ALCF2SS1-7]|uniref:Uncharacterized protein n=1 Tax=Lentinus tigrinus ALCF2SS1-6 TaxID=1328759 RepID=A0A5C2RQG9_9APHY|nr:hypothetical protein L227DRAFT_581343 [Lentinus tigrinus ALCF2SS1-6]RPD68665.1 hypothetical protein L226DRAFT_540478 [Lentinus tigrinus ALCF2SS1-7]
MTPSPSPKPSRLRLRAPARIASTVSPLLTRPRSSHPVPSRQPVPDSHTLDVSPTKQPPIARLPSPVFRL